MHDMHFSHNSKDSLATKMVAFSMFHNLKQARLSVLISLYRQPRILRMVSWPMKQKGLVQDLLGNVNK